jgi:hypothetical protein
MGLDQNLFSRKTVTIDSKGHRVDVEGKELHYWRKHNRLQGWFEQEYRRQGGENEAFNCVEVNVTTDVLDRLEEDIKNNKLPQTSGFFFGQDSYEYDTSEEDLHAIKVAREELAKGREVYYWSWW